MPICLPLYSSHDPSFLKSCAAATQSKKLGNKRHAFLLSVSSPSFVSRQDCWSLTVSGQKYRPVINTPHKGNGFMCLAFKLPSCGHNAPIVKYSVLALQRSYNVFQGCPMLLRLAPAFGLIVFAAWGVGPLLRHIRNFFLHVNDTDWKKSGTYYFLNSYLRPLLLWTGAILVCRALDPVVLPSEASQAVKTRILNFVKSLSTVSAFAYCLSSLIQQAQKFLIDYSAPGDARNMGFQFAGKAVYTAVWVAAVSLFMELLGFSTQKWLTAGGLGTVLLTLAGREIFTNFLSSVMIHATRPFVLNEWIQTKIEGYEVSGFVEHVGWWSPTIIRGEDREAIYIPNHKFTVNVVRNLSQKTHWRIKTHLAISHLDANKISNIVADMRKVLAKNPQVEQQRLHRRVFLEYINPANQAFMILVSCFVKTSHFEEYLGVKEAILLDLLRVISHHRARLATPIRTVQKIYGENDLENVPFADAIFTHAEAPLRRPLYLIEPTSRVNTEDKAKSRQTTRANEECKTSTVSGEKAATFPVTEGPVLDDRGQQNVGDPAFEGFRSNNLEDKHSQKKSKSSDIRGKSSTSDETRQSKPKSIPNSLLEGSGPVGQTSKDSPPPEPASLGKPSTSSSSSSSNGQPASLGKPSTSSSSSSSNGLENDSEVAASVHVKSENEKSLAASASTTRTIMEENIVLGVALDGAKRTLPIEEGMCISPGGSGSKDLAASLNGFPSLDKGKKNVQSSSGEGMPVMKA